MFLDLRESLCDALRKSGYRTVSPFKVSLGWIDVAVMRRRFVGIDFYEGSYESCIERLTSHPFKEVYVIGDCEGCTPLDELCRSFEINVELNTEDNLDNPTAYVKAIEDSLAYLYIAGEVYEEDVEYRPLQITLPDLKMLGFATSSSKPKLKPKMFVSLTHEGYRAARKVILRRVRRNVPKLKKLAKNDLVYIIALGLAVSLSVRGTAERPEDYSFKSLLNFMRSYPLEEFRTHSQAHHPHHPKEALCQFLVSSVLNAEAVAIANKLNRMGLAFKMKVYSPYGYESGEEYRIAREAVEALMKYSYAHIPKDLIGEFLAAVYPFSSTDIYQILSYAAKSLHNAEKAGVCRVEGSKIILTEKFPDYARVRLAMVAEKIIGDLS